jgi:BirA family biotin operon repressor/biotin-[acetyl-CoA-carboxylase] ligase
MPAARWLGKSCVMLDECGSTNDEAARLARAGALHGTVVIARAQTGGRGRDGRRWESPPDAGLYLSAVVRPPLPLVDVPPMTLAIGIGVCDAARAAGAPAELKWPNDVLVGGKKLAGVLVEAQSQGTRLEAVIVGIGVNLSGPLPVPVAETAAALAPELSSEARARFVADLLARVEHWLDRYAAGGLAEIIPAWEARMAAGLAARASIDGAPLAGVLTGLDRDGAVLLRDAAGHVHRIRSGDVEIVRAAQL